MEGQKPRHGGARQGAGRPKKAPVLIPNGDGIKREEQPVEVILAGDGKDPIAFLEDVMANPTLDAKVRIDAAKALLPYKHVRKGDVGKKEERQDAAKKVSGGKFAAAAPPLRVVGNR